MLTLIKREIEDNYVFFIAAAILSVVLSFIIVNQQYYEKKVSEESIVILFMMNAVFGMFIFCGMGAAQMFWDRTKKISALLATLAVRRGHIFTARVAAGVLLVVIGFLPSVVTMTLVLNMVESMPIETQHPISGPSAGMWAPILLFCFAGYCVGLQAGWTSNRIMPTLGALFMSLIFIGIIVIKGFELEAYLIIIPFIVCCLLRAWRTFSAAAL